MATGKGTRTETWSDTRASWRAAHEALIERFRPLYIAELERFAETLRPRFEAGELRGYIDELDDGAGRDVRLPMDRLEDLCAEYFGIAVGRRWRDFDDEDADRLTAQLILAASPAGAAVLNSNNRGVTLPALATWAVTRDVFSVAIVRGWRVPDEARDEWTPEPHIIATWANEVRS
ncbi:hypothetical protein [Anaeromyxobacter terrae]|uniref:hypothetical protein n=1 Tax=Anaeromyxobacter terrae TaxID=2925406 RepID=UPI001F59CE1C|nr:hypothetical protein [Anaeromyxobacter sp. SG22]